jgi:hypothetical protein
MIHGKRPLSVDLIRFWRSERGSIPFEAIWFALILTFFIAPTVFLYQWSQTQLYASWMQRTSARNHAMSGACNESAFIQIGLNVQLDDDTLTTVICSEKNTTEPANDKFWKKMENAVSNDFPTLVDDMKNKGDFKVHNANRHTALKRGFSVGEGSLLTDLQAGIMSGAQSWDIMVPSTDYYRWLKEHWRKGHDRVIWAGFTSDSKKMFPNVFPSR